MVWDYLNFKLLHNFVFWKFVFYHYFRCLNFSQFWQIFIVSIFCWKIRNLKISLNWTFLLSRFCEQVPYERLVNEVYTYRISWVESRFPPAMVCCQQWVLTRTSTNREYSVQMRWCGQRYHHTLCVGWNATKNSHIYYHVFLILY